MNKFLKGICILFVLLLLSCCGRREVPQLEGQDSSEASAVLAEIDSLMWQRPDSALAVLLDFAASPKADSLDEFDGHYTQLLASELLYKNDYQQSNRAELQQAVLYFDSLMMDGVGIRGVSLPFLTARAHYINGVGFYERDSVVEACGEYLKALETMEEHFQDKDLVGRKAQFMTYTYNRLGDMFEEQLLPDPAIVCYKHALLYCRRETTSKYGIPILLYSIGIQYDIANQKDSAGFYYDEALANMPDYDNIHYRDIMTNKAILAYSNLSLCPDSVIKDLKHIISLSTGENERTTRLLTLGSILFEDKQYDSARLYMETVFEQQEDISSKILAAENLSSIYQMEGDSIKALQYSLYLANFTMAEIEKKADVSSIREMFQNYLIQKQEQKAAQEKHKAVLRTVKILVPIAMVIAVVIVVLIRRRSKMHLAKQEAEAQREMEKRVKQHEKALEAEQQAHRMEQAALSGRLKRSNEKLRDVSKQLEESLAKNSLIESEASDDYSAYINTPICLYIINLVHKQQFKSKMDYLIYKDYALSKEQLLALRDAAEKHLAHFNSQIRKRFPNLTDSDMDYCYLFLLGLGEADISALMQRAYTTVCDRSRKISRIIGADDSLYQTLHNTLYEN